MAWRANGKRDLPLADRARAWDGPAADRRVRAWAGGPAKEDINWPRYRSAFFAFDDEAEDFGGVKLGFADVVDGELVAVPRGIFAAAGGRGVNAADLPEPVRAEVRRRVSAYYRRMREEFDDEGIESPFEAAGRVLSFERKTAIEYREGNDEGRTVTGFPSVTGVLDDGGDVIMPGAYLKTVAERGTRMQWLWQHDAGQPPIARIMELGEVSREALPDGLLQRWPDATGGLRVKREYLDTPRGNEVLAAIRAGALNELSIGYDAVKAEFPENEMRAGRPVRRKLAEVRLWEMSDVLWGMNAAATNLKSVTHDDAADWLGSRVLLDGIELADELVGAGVISRDERTALRDVWGDVVEDFKRRLQAEAWQGVRAQVPEPEPAARQIAADMLRRRAAIMRQRLALGAR